MKLLAPITAIIAAASAGRIYAGQSAAGYAGQSAAGNAGQSAAGYASQSALGHADQLQTTYIAQSAEGFANSAELFQPSFGYQQRGLNSDKDREAVYSSRPAEYGAGVSGRQAEHELLYSNRAEENEASYSSRPAELESTYSSRAEKKEATFSGSPAENEATYSSRPEENGAVYSNSQEEHGADYSSRQAKQKPARILAYKAESNGHAYKYAFETENGIKTQQAGETSGHGISTHGSYSYTGDDGHVYTVTYTADEHGFHPQGAHLPTAAPIPEAIQKGLLQTARDEAAGIYDDGQYKKQSEYRRPQGSQQQEASYQNYQTGNQELSGYKGYSGNQGYSGQQESAYQGYSGQQESAYQGGYKSSGQASGADLAYRAHGNGQQ